MDRKLVLHDSAYVVLGDVFAILPTTLGVQQYCPFSRLELREGLLFLSRGSVYTRCL